MGASRYVPSEAVAAAVAPATGSVAQTVMPDRGWPVVASVTLPVMTPPTRRVSFTTVVFGAVTTTDFAVFQSTVW